jgi:hypothetical protein
MELEINNRRNLGKSPNTWKLSTMFLTNRWVKEEIEREFFDKYLETNDSGNTIYQNL